MLERRGKLRLYDALLAAISQFPVSGAPNRKCVIVVFTNNVDLGSVHTRQEVIQEAVSHT